MNIFERIQERIAPRKRMTLEDIIGINLTADGITVNQALEIPAFSASVDFIANTVAGLPIKLYTENAEKFTTDEAPTDYRLSLLNDEPGGLYNGYEMKRAAVRDMLLYGSGYIYIERRNGKIHSLRYVENTDVTVAVNSDPIYRFAEILVAGKRYWPWDFIVLNRAGSHAGKGGSVIDNCRTLLTAAYSMLRLEKDMAQAGGSKKGFLQAEKRLSQEAVDELEIAWRRLYSNTGNRAIVLNDGVKYQPGSDSAQDLQLNQNKSTNADQIAMAMGLSPKVISGSASEAEYMSAVRTAVMPVVQTFQAAINRSVLDETEKQSKYFTVDMTELLRGDIRSRYEAYRVGLEANFLQIDEIRYKEDLPPLGMNYIKLGLQDVLYDPKTKEIYTPNTKELAKIGEENFEKGIDKSGNYDIIKSSPEERYNPNHNPVNGQFTSGQSVKLPDGRYGKLAKNGEVTKIVRFAGKGTNKPVKVAKFLSKKFNNRPDDWSKSRGDGYVEYPDKSVRHVELHWFESPQSGVFDLKVKRELK